MFVNTSAHRFALNSSFLNGSLHFCDTVCCLDVLMLFSELQEEDSLAKVR